MTTSLTPSALCKVVSFVHCNCPLSQPNFDKARECARTLTNELDDSEATLCAVLNVAEYEARKRGDRELADLLEKTHETHIEKLDAIREGRSR